MAESDRRQPPVLDRSYRRLAHEVASELQRRIRVGELERGRRLPSERDLVDEFEVSRTVLREALSSMEVLGLVETRAGRGRYVADRPSMFAGDALVSAWLDQHAAEMREVDELKAVVEAQAVRGMSRDDAYAAAHRARLVLEDQRSALHRGDAVQAAAADAQFHSVLISYTKNKTLRSLAQAIIDAAQPPGIAVFSSAEKGQRSLEQHQAIVDELAQGKVGRAATLLSRHTLDRRRWVPAADEDS